MHSSTENLTNTLIKIANHDKLNLTKKIENRINSNNDSIIINTANKAEKSEDELEDDDSRNDSIHGDNVRSNKDRRPNRNFNTFANKPNACDCKHGGECLPASKTCYCSHGFTGKKCQKRIRKVLVVGGLRDVQIRPDSELVGGLEVERCSPPPYPRPIIAATGQTSEDTVVVCGGATMIGKEIIGQEFNVHKGWAFE